MELFRVHFKLFDSPDFIYTGNAFIKMVWFVVKTLWIGNSFFWNLYFAVDCGYQANGFVSGLFDFESNKVKHNSFHFLWVNLLVPYLNVNHQTISETFKLVEN